VCRAAGVLAGVPALCPGRGRYWKILVSRLRRARRGVSHALLPAFTLAWRLDVAETIGSVAGEVAAGGCGVLPAAERAGVPYTTARGWVRRFRARAAELGWRSQRWRWSWVAGGHAPGRGGPVRANSIGAAFAAAASLPGWGRLGAWRFASAVTGGRLIAAGTVSPWYVVGRRRLMPPIPP
jgi:hypothetical protein